MYRRCEGLVHGKHTVTGAACCDKNGRGTCQHPPTALAFEIRRPAPTKPTTKAPVTKAPTKPPTKPPTKSPVTKPPTKAPVTKTPTKAPLKVCEVPGSDGDRSTCCGAGVLAANSLGGCCKPSEIVRFDPNGIDVFTTIYFDKCCPQEAAVLIAGICCPAGTALAGFSLVTGFNECCKPGDILAPAPFPGFEGLGFCCPNGTDAATINPEDGTTVCCPRGTGVNLVTTKCCADGQMECTPKPSPSCAVVGNDGDRDECCGAGVLAANSNYECCAPNDILVKVMMESSICCPAGTALADSEGQCCKPGDILIPYNVFGRAKTMCCPNSTIALGGSPQVCCPPSTGVNPVTQKCCADGQRELVTMETAMSGATKPVSLRSLRTTNVAHPARLFRLATQSETRPGKSAAVQQESWWSIALAIVAPQPLFLPSFQTKRKSVVHPGPCSRIPNAYAASPARFSARFSNQAVLQYTVAPPVPMCRRTMQFTPRRAAQPIRAPI
jgi:hypothetical protein